MKAEIKQDEPLRRTRQMHATRDAQPGKIPCPIRETRLRSAVGLMVKMLGKMLVVETQSSPSAIARVSLSVQRREK